jgi:hypothetical protein
MLCNVGSIESSGELISLKSIHSDLLLLLPHPGYLMSCTICIFFCNLGWRSVTITAWPVTQCEWTIPPTYITNRSILSIISIELIMS